MNKYKGEFGLFLVAIVWGSGFVGTQLSLEGGLTPLQVITFRFLIGSILINLIFFKTIKSNINKKAIKSGIILGVILFIAFALQTVGLLYTTASKNAFLTAVNVIVVPFIGFIVYKRKLDKISIITSITTLIGIGIISLQNNFSINIGDLLTILCAILFGFHIFFTSEYSSDNNPFVLTSIQFITTFILSFILQICVGEFSIDTNTSGYLGVLYLGIFTTTLAFLMQTLCQSKVDSSKSAIILSTEAVFGAIFSVVFLGEVLTYKMMLGSLMILLSIIGSETKFEFLRNKSSENLENNNT